eukprot:GHVP01064499.1.p1 GENE.GHVP01064499.1~~GHVP01064499.1.p1  ORF type:complete len:2205 (-),score=292.21 GHVP01064499.1:334-6882(-)
MAKVPRCLMLLLPIGFFALIFAFFASRFVIIFSPSKGLRHTRFRSEEPNLKNATDDLCYVKLKHVKFRGWKVFLSINQIGLFINKLSHSVPKKQKRIVKNERHQIWSIIRQFIDEVIYLLLGCVEVSVDEILIGYNLKNLILTPREEFNSYLYESSGQQNVAFYTKIYNFRLFFNGNFLTPHVKVSSVTIDSSLTSRKDKTHCANFRNLFEALNAGEVVKLPTCDSQNYLPFHENFQRRVHPKHFRFPEKEQLLKTQEHRIATIKEECRINFQLTRAGDGTPRRRKLELTKLSIDSDSSLEIGICINMILETIAIFWRHAEERREYASQKNSSAPNDTSCKKEALKKKEAQIGKRIEFDAQLKGPIICSCWERNLEEFQLYLECSSAHLDGFLRLGIPDKFEIKTTYGSSSLSIASLDSKTGIYYLEKIAFVSPWRMNLVQTLKSDFIPISADGSSYTQHISMTLPDISLYWRSSGIFLYVTLLMKIQSLHKFMKRTYEGVSSEVQRDRSAPRRCDENVEINVGVPVHSSLLDNSEFSLETEELLSCISNLERTQKTSKVSFFLAIERFLLFADAHTATPNSNNVSAMCAKGKDFTLYQSYATKCTYMALCEIEIVSEEVPILLDSGDSNKNIFASFLDFATLAFPERDKSDVLTNFCFSSETQFLSQVSRLSPTVLCSSLFIRLPWQRYDPLMPIGVEVSKTELRVNSSFLRTVWGIVHDVFWDLYFKKCTSFSSDFPQPVLSEQSSIVIFESTDIYQENIGLHASICSFRMTKHPESGTFTFFVEDGLFTRKNENSGIPFCSLKEMYMSLGPLESIDPYFSLYDFKNSLVANRLATDIRGMHFLMFQDLANLATKEYMNQLFEVWKYAGGMKDILKSISFTKSGRILHTYPYQEFSIRDGDLRILPAIQFVKSNAALQKASIYSPSPPSMCPFHGIPSLPCLSCAASDPSICCSICMYILKDTSGTSFDKKFDLSILTSLWARSELNRTKRSHPMSNPVYNPQESPTCMERLEEIVLPLLTLSLPRFVMWHRKINPEHLLSMSSLGRTLINESAKIFNLTHCMDQKFLWSSGVELQMLESIRSKSNLEKVDALEDLDLPSNNKIIAKTGLGNLAILVAKCRSRRNQSFLITKNVEIRIFESPKYSILHLERIYNKFSKTSLFKSSNSPGKSQNRFSRSDKLTISCSNTSIALQMNTGIPNREIEASLVVPDWQSELRWSRYSSSRVQLQKLHFTLETTLAEGAYLCFGNRKSALLDLGFTEISFRLHQAKPLCSENDLRNETRRFKLEINFNQLDSLDRVSSHSITSLSHIFLLALLLNSIFSGPDCKWPKKGQNMRRHEIKWSGQTRVQVEDISLVLDNVRVLGAKFSHIQNVNIKPDFGASLTLPSPILCSSLVSDLSQEFNFNDPHETHSTNDFMIFSTEAFTEASSLVFGLCPITEYIPGPFQYKSKANGGVSLSSMVPVFRMPVMKSEYRTDEGFFISADSGRLMLESSIVQELSCLVRSLLILKKTYFTVKPSYQETSSFSIKAKIFDFQTAVYSLCSNKIYENKKHRLRLQKISDSCKTDEIKDLYSLPEVLLKCRLYSKCPKTFSPLLSSDITKGPLSYSPLELETCALDATVDGSVCILEVKDLNTSINCMKANDEVDNKTLVDFTEAVRLYFSPLVPFGIQWAARSVTQEKALSDYFPNCESPEHLDQALKGNKTWSRHARRHEVTPTVTIQRATVKWRQKELQKSMLLLHIESLLLDILHDEFISIKNVFADVDRTWRKIASHYQTKVKEGALWDYLDNCSSSALSSSPWRGEYEQSSTRRQKKLEKSNLAIVDENTMIESKLFGIDSLEKGSMSKRISKSMNLADAIQIASKNRKLLNFSKMTKAKKPSVSLAHGCVRVTDSNTEITCRNSAALLEDSDSSMSDCSYGTETPGKGITERPHTAETAIPLFSFHCKLNSAVCWFRGRPLETTDAIVIDLSGITSDTRWLSDGIVTEDLDISTGNIRMHVPSSEEWKTILCSNHADQLASEIANEDETGERAYQAAVLLSFRIAYKYVPISAKEFLRCFDSVIVNAAPLKLDIHQKVLEELGVFMRGKPILVDEPAIISMPLGKKHPAFIAKDLIDVVSEEVSEHSVENFVALGSFYHYLRVSGVRIELTYRGSVTVTVCTDGITSFDTFRMNFLKSNLG